MNQEQNKPLGELRVVLVDDHTMFRAGVRHEVGKLCQVVGEGHNVASPVATILKTKPDVVLLDVHLPGGGGAEVIKQVVAKAPDVEFLALSVSDTAEDVISAVRAGARGYVTKSVLSEELVGDIRRVASGNVVFSSRPAGFILGAFSGVVNILSIDEELDRLNSREHEVLKLITRGYSYREVAQELFISIKTVETHISSVLWKLRLSNRHQPTKWAADRHPT